MGGWRTGCAGGAGEAECSLPCALRGRGYCQAFQGLRDAWPVGQVVPQPQALGVARRSAGVVALVAGQLSEKAERDGYPAAVAELPLEGEALLKGCGSGGEVAPADGKLTELVERPGESL